MAMTTTVSATVQPRRLYQLWKGSNSFFCGGRLIFGPDVASLFLTMAMIAGPAITFCYQVLMKIHKYEVDDHEDLAQQTQILGFPVLMVTLVLMISDLAFLILTSSRDPGIVPRNAYPPDASETFDTTTPSMEWINGRTPHLKLPRTKDVVINGFAVKVKYCDTCLLYRPPRASHCSICNNCVQKFDHHCPWVGQCIGLRNYRFFFLFISTSTFLCIYVFTFSWLNLLQERKHYHNSLWRCMKGEILSLVLIIYTFVAVWFVGGLTVFHVYLMSTNQTTYENFRYRYDKKENPFNKGLWGNIKDVFFTKIPPSMNNFRSWVEEETVEAACFSQHIGREMINSKEKFDIEAGGKLGSHGGMGIPSILQNLDYGSIDDQLSEKDRQKSSSFDQFVFPVLSKPSAQEPKDCNQTYRADGQLVNERNNKGANQSMFTEWDDQASYTSGIKDSVDHDINVRRT